MSKFLNENHYPKGLYFVREVIGFGIGTNEKVDELIDDVLSTNQYRKARRIFVLNFHYTENKELLGYLTSVYEENFKYPRDCKYPRLFLAYENTKIWQSDPVREWNEGQISSVAN